MTVESPSTSVTRGRGSSAVQSPFKISEIATPTHTLKDVFTTWRRINTAALAYLRGDPSTREKGLCGLVENLNKLTQLTVPFKQHLPPEILLKGIRKTLAIAAVRDSEETLRVNAIQGLALLQEISLASIGVDGGELPIVIKDAVRCLDMIPKIVAFALSQDPSIDVRAAIVRSFAISSKKVEQIARTDMAIPVRRALVSALQENASKSQPSSKHNQHESSSPENSGATNMKRQTTEPPSTKGESLETQPQRPPQSKAA